MTVYLLCGLAFSGKSTLAAALRRRLGCALVSLDELNARRGLHGGLGIPEEEWARTHREALTEVEAALQSGRSVIVDDTNCFRFLRDGYRGIADRYGVPTVVLYLEAPLDLVRARMQANALEPMRAPVTEAVLLDLLEKFEPPAADETVLVVPAGASLEDWVATNLHEPALAVVESSSEEKIVLLDATDFRLLRALAASAPGSAEMDSDALVIREYLDEQISLGKAAERMGLSRFELQERLNRLGAPLRLGPSSIEEAQAEIAALRRSRQTS